MSVSTEKLEVPKKEERLADEHWKWIAGIFDNENRQNVNIGTAEYLYKTAFIHGWKHANK